MKKIVASRIIRLVMKLFIESPNRSKSHKGLSSRSISKPILDQYLNIIVVYSQKNIQSQAAKTQRTSNIRYQINVNERVKYLELQ